MSVSWARDVYKRQAEVLIRKHRNGSIGTVELQFVGELTQFRDVEFRDLGPEQ